MPNTPPDGVFLYTDGVRLPADAASRPEAEHKARLSSVVVQFAAHPDVGPPIVDILTEGDGRATRSVARELKIEYTSLAKSRPTTARPLAGHDSITFLLTQMAGQKGAYVTAQAMVDAGLVATPADVVGVWERLAGHLSGFVRTDGERAIVHARQIELVRLRLGFGEQPPGKLLHALLYVGGVREEFHKTMLDRLVGIPSGSVSPSYGHGLEMLRSLVAEANQGLRREVSEDTPGGLRRLADERLVLNRLLDHRSPHQNAYESTLRIFPYNTQDVQGVMQRGLLRTLEYFVRGRNLDAAKLLKLVELPEVEVPVSALWRPVTLTPEEIAFGVSLIDPIVRPPHVHDPALVARSARTLLVALQPGGPDVPIETLHHAYNTVQNHLTMSQRRTARILLNLSEDAPPEEQPRGVMIGRLLARLEAMLHPPQPGT